MSLEFFHRSFLLYFTTFSESMDAFYHKNFMMKVFCLQSSNNIIGIVHGPRVDCMVTTALKTNYYFSGEWSSWTVDMLNIFRKPQLPLSLSYREND